MQSISGEDTVRRLTNSRTKDKNSQHSRQVNRVSTVDHVCVRDARGQGDFNSISGRTAKLLLGMGRLGCKTLNQAQTMEREQVKIRTEET